MSQDIIRFRGDDETFGLKVTDNRHNIYPAYKRPFTDRAQEAWDWIQYSTKTHYIPEDQKETWASHVPVRFMKKEEAALFVLFWIDGDDLVH